MLHQPLHRPPSASTAVFDQGISEQHLNALENTSAVTMWRDIARQLCDEYRPKRPFAFLEGRVEEIAKKKNNIDRECLRAVLISWRDRSCQHSVGALCRVLVDVGLGRIAEEVFGFPAWSMSE